MAAVADYDYLIKLLLIGDTAYYGGVMGILLVYNVTNKSSFNNIRNWISSIEPHASDEVNKILVGAKADMDESKRAVYASEGQALADEYGIKFFETVMCNAERNDKSKCGASFLVNSRDVIQRFIGSDFRAEPTKNQD